MWDDEFDDLDIDGDAPDWDWELALSRLKVALLEAFGHYGTSLIPVPAPVAGWRFRPQLDETELMSITLTVRHEALIHQHDEVLVWELMAEGRRA
jgi:hypothetical protein